MNASKPQWSKTKELIKNNVKDSHTKNDYIKYFYAFFFNVLPTFYKP